MNWAYLQMQNTIRRKASAQVINSPFESSMVPSARIENESNCGAATWMRKNTSPTYCRGPPSAVQINIMLTGRACAQPAVLLDSGDSDSETHWGNK
mmetsp:Transcript_23703/g.56136  ORF Transcript_23703/g.56136 Transcript_23703/m.56136 type:complete len:96 (+) Transcript_23703:2204-2491(+)